MAAPALISLLTTQPSVFILLAAALILSLTVHEFAHAFVSDKLGDPTAKSLGRVTLNPLAHLDPLGTALLLFAGFGWGKPVPFNPNYLKNPKRDAALISFAGPAANFILAAFFALTLKLLAGTGVLNDLTGGFLYLTVFYNLVLGIFNLLPIHPLDGFKVVNGFLPERLSYQWLQMAPYGIFMLLLLILTNTTSKFISASVSFALSILGLPSAF